MKQRLFAFTTHFPGHARKRRDAAAIFAHFNNPGGDKLLQAGLQFGSEFHMPIINDVRSCS
jgi:hypothetical protein